MEHESKNVLPPLRESIQTSIRMLQPKCRARDNTDRAKYMPRYLGFAITI